MSNTLFVGREAGRGGGGGEGVRVSGSMGIDVHIVHSLTLKGLLYIWK